MDESARCKWVHLQLRKLPTFRFPYAPNSLPRNGIYFFQEDGQAWGHGGNYPRIVRVGTHRDGNFRNRIAEHFLIRASKMDFSQNKAAPKDRSIFRKNLGRTLLNARNDAYLMTWNYDFTKKDMRKRFSHLRNIDLEKRVELQITEILRKRFSFICVRVDDERQRIGSEGLESKLIGVISKCRVCKPSPAWLGLKSPEKKIRESGLWQVNHLYKEKLSSREADQFGALIKQSGRQ